MVSGCYAREKAFIVAPSSEELCRTIHKAKQQMMKMKNATSDKSISIQELILDNELDENNRDLEFDLEEALHILKVKL